MRYFEDVAAATPVRVGPVRVTAAELAAFVALTGERHPLHTSDGIVPLSLVQARAAGALIDHGGAMAVLGLRRVTWRCISPVLIDRDWWVLSSVQSALIVDDTCGVITCKREIRCDDVGALAVGVLDIAVARRTT